MNHLRLHLHQVVQALAQDSSLPCCKQRLSHGETNFFSLVESNGAALVIFHRFLKNPPLVFYRNLRSLTKKKEREFDKQRVVYNLFTQKEQKFCLKPIRTHNLKIVKMKTFLVFILVRAKRKPL